jgi:transposase
MPSLHLTPQQRFRLRQQLRHTKDAGLFRRTLAVLQLDQGQAPAVVAAELGVCCRSVQRWLEHYLTTPTPRALVDHRGYAHTTAWDEELQAVLRCALTQPPGSYGYQDLEWTVSLLQEHLARWDGRVWSDTTLRRQLHRLGYAWKRPRYVLIPDPQRARKIRRIHERIQELGFRSVLLFEDETDVLLFPPLRACWGERGQAVEVPLSGRNARRVVFGALEVQTGHRVLLARKRQRGEDFRAFLELLHTQYRGWRVSLLLDGDTSHTAAASRGLAREYEIELIWLPKRCPELNAMDHLWGHAKDEICANHQDPSIDHLVATFIQHIQSLSVQEVRRKAGILSDDFWLKDVCDI